MEIYVGMGIEKVIIFLDSLVKLAAEWTLEIHIHEVLLNVNTAADLTLNIQMHFSLPLTKAGC